MYSFTFSAIEAAELLQKLSVDSQSKTIDVLDAPKKVLMLIWISIHIGMGFCYRGGFSITLTVFDGYAAIR